MFKRLNNSAVVWSWIFNGVRLVSGIVLLPLIVHALSTADFGMYYVLLSLAGLAPIIDFGFGPTMGRFVSYAVGGAETLHAHGPPTPGKSGTPNYELLWQLLHTTRTLYRYVALGTLVVMGIWGTWLVELRIGETSSVSITRLAWAVTLASTVFDIYWNWWTTYLTGLNEVRAAARISVLAMSVKLVLAAALLLSGAGLLSLPIATLFSSALQRGLARRLCLARLQGHPPPVAVEVNKYFRILWPNSWRLGVQSVSGYLTVNANIAICLAAFGLAANARYGLSVQLMAIATGMANVWFSVKLPLINQCHARHDYAGLRRILWPRVLAANHYFPAARQHGGAPGACPFEMVREPQTNVVRVLAVGFDVVHLPGNAALHLDHADGHGKPAHLSLADRGHEYFQPDIVTGAGAFHDPGSRRTGAGTTAGRRRLQLLVLAAICRPGNWDNVVPFSFLWPVPAPASCGRRMTKAFDS